MVDTEGGRGQGAQDRSDKVPLGLFLLPGLALIVMAAAIVISFLPSAP